jgi:hypothetical protein
MPNKKQSARPAESGWLLEVGVIGIAKTLKLLEVHGCTLLELEQLLRPLCRQGVKMSDKAKLPWLKIPSAPWERAHPLGSWMECLGRATTEKGKALTKSEWQTLACEWHSEIPGEDEFHYFNDTLGRFELAQKAKGLSRGRGREREYRPSLEKWMFGLETLKLFEPGAWDNDEQRKKFERIKEHSLALGGALVEIAGRGKVKSLHYPQKIEKIITHSLTLPLRRRANLSRMISSAKALLKEHDAKRALLSEQVESLRERWKKVGRK